MAEFALCDRFKRQYGIVHQDKVEDLIVLISGHNPIFPHLLMNLTLLGMGNMQGGIYIINPKEVVEEQDVECQLLFNQDDIGRDYTESLLKHIKRLNENAKVYFLKDPQEVLPDAFVALPVDDNDVIAIPKHMVPIWGQLGSVSSYFGNRRLSTSDFEPNILTASLASLTGALIAQEILRISYCLRQYTILKSWITANYLVKTEAEYMSSIPDSPEFRLELGAESLKFFSEEQQEEQQAIYRVEIPSENELGRIIFDSIDLVERVHHAKVIPHSKFIFSLFDGAEIKSNKLIEPTIKLPNIIKKKNIFVAGVGALGSWITALFSTSFSKDCTITIVDPDHKVEPHNLNRQILFQKEDIGKSKVQAAKEELILINRTNKIREIFGGIDANILRYLEKVKLMKWEDFIKIPDYVEIEGEQFPNMDKDINPVIAQEMINADVILSGLDNMKTRYILNLVSKKTNKCFINGGTEEFEGKIDRYKTKKRDACLLCRYGPEITDDDTVMSCTEEGVVPIQSIVTTNAIVSSIQCLFTILELSNIDLNVNYVTYSGRKMEFNKFCFEMLSDICPEHLTLRT